MKDDRYETVMRCYMYSCRTLLSNRRGAVTHSDEPVIFS